MGAGSSGGFRKRGTWCINFRGGPIFVDAKPTFWFILPVLVICQISFTLCTSDLVFPVNVLCAGAWTNNCVQRSKSQPNV